MSMSLIHVNLLLRVGWAYLTNYVDPGAWVSGRIRWRPLVETLFACVHKLEGVHVERKMLKTMEELDAEKTRTGAKL